MKKELAGPQRLQGLRAQDVQAGNGWEGGEKGERRDGVCITSLPFMIRYPAFPPPFPSLYPALSARKEGRPSGGNDRCHHRPQHHAPSIPPSLPVRARDQVLLQMSRRNGHGEGHVRGRQDDGEDHALLRGEDDLVALVLELAGE